MKELNGQVLDALNAHKFFTIIQQNSTIYYDHIQHFRYKTKKKNLLEMGKNICLIDGSITTYQDY